MLRTQIAAAIGCARANALDEIMREVWTRFSAGQLSEEDAGQLDAIDHLSSHERTNYPLALVVDDEDAEHARRLIAGYNAAAPLPGEEPDGCPGVLLC